MQQLGWTQEHHAQCTKPVSEVIHDAVSFVAFRMTPLQRWRRVNGCQKTQRKVGGNGCEEGSSCLVVGHFSFVIVVMITYHILHGQITQIYMHNKTHSICKTAESGKCLQSYPNINIIIPMSISRFCYYAIVVEDVITVGSWVGFRELHTLLLQFPVNL